MPETAQKKLATELATELVELVHKIERETTPQYLAVVRRCSELRSLVKGDRADWYTGDYGPIQEWRSWSQHPDYKPEDAKYDENINFSQAWWQILQSAVQTIGIPGATFRPQNPNQIEDVEAAATGKEVIDYQRTVVDFRDLMMGIYRLCYTDGIVLAYSRHCKDKQKYGETPISEDIVEQGVVREAGYQCFNESCNTFTPAGMTARDGTGAIQCPACGYPLHEENYETEQTGPVVTGQTKRMVPNGREICDLYGALETLLPWWAKDLEHSGYCMIKTGVPKHEIIAAFPSLENEISDGGSDMGKPGNMEREQARAPMNSPGGYAMGTQFPTYYRVWLRPTQFFRIGDKAKRAELLRLFPDGVFFQMAGDTFLDTDEKLGCWNEKMESKLTLIRPFKGDGMYTPAIGQSGVPIHRSANTAWNMSLEAMERCAFSSLLVNDAVINAKALTGKRMQAGIITPIDVKGGGNIKDNYAEIKSQDVSQSAQSFIAMAQPMAEFLLGTVNALQGQPITNVRTSAGQAQSRSQGLQRQAPTYGAVKAGLAAIQGQLVNEFLGNQNAETFYEITGESGDRERRKIELGPERGNVVAYPEVSEAIPQTWAQTQERAAQLLESAAQNPVTQKWLMHPKNTKWFFDVWGMPGLTVPGSTMVTKYERIIQELLDSKPIPPPSGALPDENGQPPQPTIAIPFNPTLDTPEIAVAVIQEWAATKAGMTAEKNKPDGFKCIEMFCQQAMEQIAKSQPQEQPKPSDPQKMEITQLQEENKRAIAQMQAQTQQATEQLQAETEKWLEEHEADLKLFMQSRQLSHDRYVADNPPPASTQ